jgi:hypothetical protein
VRVFALSAIFLAVFAITLVVSTPLSPLLQLAAVERHGFAYDRATGTLWGGEVAGLRVGRERLGDVRVALAPRSLLAGRVRAGFQIRGAMRGRGEAEYGLDGTWLVEEATFAVSMTDLGRLHPELKDRGGELYVALDRAQLDARRTCLSAEGRARTDVLSRGIGGLADWRGPVLEGEIVCEAGNVVVRLAGADERARVVAEARIDLATGSTFIATVETADPDMRLALAALGFAEREGSFAYSSDTVFSDGRGG